MSTAVSCDRPLLVCRIHQTPSVSVDRPDEFYSDFLIISLIQVSSSSRLRTLQPQQQQQLPELQQQTSAGQVEGQTSRSSAGIQDHSETRHVSCLIKVCAQDYQHVSWQIPHLVSRVGGTRSCLFMRCSCKLEALCTKLCLVSSLDVSAACSPIVPNLT